MCKTLRKTSNKIKNNANGRSDLHCKLKEILLIRDLKPMLIENVGSTHITFLVE